jgi:hypothetical protein
MERVVPADLTGAPQETGKKGARFARSFFLADGFRRHELHTWGLPGNGLAREVERGDRGHRRGECAAVRRRSGSTLANFKCLESQNSAV